MKNYVGNSLQVRGAERYVLEGGKGSGMHFICVRNGMGLEPGNCTPDGRAALRANGTLKFLKPDESCTTAIEFRFVSDKDTFESNF